VNDELILDKFNQQHIQDAVKSLEKISIAHLPVFPPGKINPNLLVWFIRIYFFASYVSLPY
jgi:hypothetical protein